MKKTIIITAIIVLIVSSGIANSIKINNSIAENNYVNTLDSTAQWTVMAYIAGDNELDYMWENSSIEWLADDSYSEQVNIVAQFDADTIFNGIRRYSITESGAEIVETITEKSTGKKETLVEFVTWAKSNYPANKYCLVLSGHGVGWRNGFLLDNTDNDYLSIFELKNAMREIKQALNKKIELVVFDACQMAMFEVYYQIRDYVNICVGTPELIPVITDPADPTVKRSGCPYHWILPDLVENPSCDEETLANYFVHGYKTEYSIIKVESYDIEFLSNTVVGKLDEFATVLKNKYKTYKKEIQEAIDDAVSYDGLTEQGVYITHYKNIYSFAMKLENSIDDEEIIKKSEDLRDLLWECKLSSGGYPGLSIYLPVYSLRFKYDDSYPNLDLCSDTNWDEFTDKTRRLTNNNILNRFFSNIRALGFLESFISSFYQ